MIIYNELPVCYFISRISWDDFYKVGSLVIQAFTLFIAWKLYENLDFKKQFLNKQLSVVSELSIAITKTRFTIGYYDKSPPLPNETIQAMKEHGIPATGDYSIWGFEEGFSLLRNLNPVYTTVFIFTNNINEIFPFLEYKDNPFLPSKIAKNLNNLHMRVEYSFANINESLPDKYILLSANSNGKLTDDGRSRYRYKYRSVSELNEQVNSLYIEIMDWLKKNGAEDINFG